MHNGGDYVAVADDVALMFWIFWYRCFFPHTLRNVSPPRCNTPVQQSVFSLYLQKSNQTNQPSIVEIKQLLKKQNIIGVRLMTNFPRRVESMLQCQKNILMFWCYLGQQIFKNKKNIRATQALLVTFQRSLFSVQLVVFSVQCAVFSVHSAVFSVQCAVYSVQCAVCSDWQSLSVL